MCYSVRDPSELIIEITWKSHKDERFKFWRLFVMLLSARVTAVGGGGNVQPIFSKMHLSGPHNPRHCRWAPCARSWSSARWHLTSCRGWRKPWRRNSRPKRFFWWGSGFQGLIRVCRFLAGRGCSDVLKTVFGFP